MFYHSHIEKPPVGGALYRDWQIQKNVILRQYFGTTRDAANVLAELIALWV